MPILKPTLTQEEQDRLYEDLYIATDFGKFSYEKAKQLLLAGVKASNPRVEKKFENTSVVSNILGLCCKEELALELLQIIYEHDESPDKSLIRHAQFSGGPFLLSALKWGHPSFKLADFLIDVAGVSVDQRDSTGETALYFVVKHTTERNAPHMLPRLHYLLNRGACLDITNNQGIPLVAVIKVDVVKALFRESPQGYLVSEYEQQQAKELQQQAAEQHQLYSLIERERINKEFELARLRRQTKPHHVAELLKNLPGLFKSTNRYQPIPASEERVDRMQKKQL